MAVKEVTISGSEYLITRLDAMKASYLAMKLMPVMSMMQAIVTGGGTEESLGSALGVLPESSYTDLVESLFSKIKKRTDNALYDISKNGIIVYDDIRTDYTIFLSLLFESFSFSFSDFLASVASASEVMTTNKK